MKEKDLDLIEKYYNNQLTDEERSDFEDRKVKDSDFALSVELFEVSKAVIQNNHRDRLLANAQSYMDEYESSTNRRIPFFLNRRLQIAAVMLLLVAAIFLIRNNLSSPTPERLFAQHFEVPSATNARSTNSSVDKIWEQAATAYNEAAYPEAIQLMQDLVKNDSLNFRDRVYFHLGLSQIINDDLEDGIKSLDQVSKVSSYAQQAQWYAAMAYLKAADIPNTTMLLQEISNSKNHYKRKVAEEILLELR
ncbi:MAG: hypothetical protein AAF573_01720 [Bacteroidota bacterium]